MTIEEIRIQIAEADGWTVQKTVQINPGTSMWVSPDGQWFDHADHSLPDYLNSRDAIVGAILRRFVCIADKERFADKLWRECHGTNLAEDKLPVSEVTCDENLFALATATPKQLCSAFLAAIK